MPSLPYKGSPALQSHSLCCASSSTYLERLPKKSRLPGYHKSKSLTPAMQHSVFYSDIRIRNGTRMRLASRNRCPRGRSVWRDHCHWTQHIIEDKRYTQAATSIIPYIAFRIVCIHVCLTRHPYIPDRAIASSVHPKMPLGSRNSPLHCIQIVYIHCCLHAASVHSRQSHRHISSRASQKAVGPPQLTSKKDLPWEQWRTCERPRPILQPTSSLRRRSQGMSLLSEWPHSWDGGMEPEHLPRHHIQYQVDPNNYSLHA